MAKTNQFTSSEHSLEKLLKNRCPHANRLLSAKPSHTPGQGFEMLLGEIFYEDSNDLSDIGIAGDPYDPGEEFEAKLLEDEFRVVERIIILDERREQPKQKRRYSEPSKIPPAPLERRGTLPIVKHRLRMANRGMQPWDAITSLIARMRKRRRTTKHYIPKNEDLRHGKPNDGKRRETCRPATYRGETRLFIHVDGQLFVT